MKLNWTENLDGHTWTGTEIGSTSGYGETIRFRIVAKHRILESDTSWGLKKRYGDTWESLGRFKDLDEAKKKAEAS